MELKTINELDILAQVLNKLQSNDTSTPETSTESTTSSDNTPIQHHNILPNDNTTIDPNGRFYQPQSTNEATIGYGSMISNQTERLTEFPRYASTYQSNENYYNFDNRNKPTAQHISNTVDVLPTTVIPNNEFYYNYNSPTLASNSYNLTNHNYNVHVVGYNMNNVDTAITAYDSSTMMMVGGGQLEKSKSKSVPDILKELNDELSNSEMKRQRNNSQSIACPTDGMCRFA